MLSSPQDIEEEKINYYSLSKYSLEATKNEGKTDDAACREK